MSPYATSTVVTEFFAVASPFSFSLFVAACSASVSDPCPYPSCLYLPWRNLLLWGPAIPVAICSTLIGTSICGPSRNKYSDMNDWNQDIGKDARADPVGTIIHTFSAITPKSEVQSFRAADAMLLSFTACCGFGYDSARGLPGSVHLVGRRHCHGGNSPGRAGQTGRPLCNDSRVPYQ